MKQNIASALSKTLLGRALKFSSENDIKLAKYIFDNTYNRNIRPRVCHPTPVGVNGLVDTAHYLYLVTITCIISSICKVSCQHFNFNFLRKLSLWLL